jgi:polyphosphate kinase
VATPIIDADPRGRLIDRELSWLAFNERVLTLAEDPSLPLLERCRFLAIFSSNLDDFYMIRVATLKRKIETGLLKPNSAGISPIELLEKISETTRALIARQTECFHQSILPELTKNGIEIITWDRLTDTEVEYIRQIFENRIFPVLTPLAVDPSHPFPYISGLSLNLAVVLKKPGADEDQFARVKVPSNLPRFIPTSDRGTGRFIPLEQVLSENLDQLFPGMTIIQHHTFRVTRNADLELEEEESEDLLATMEQELLRRKFGPPVRLEVEDDIDTDLLHTLVDELDILDPDIVRYQGPLDLTALNTLIELDRPELKYPAFQSQIPWGLRDVDTTSDDEFFDSIKRREILIHHPYESFSASVVRFLEAAATDPHVLAIKQTLYRTSGDSPIVQALIEAAEAGKQVLAVIEIRARFDELANVRWARKLEDAGVHVVYGLVGFKTHAKLSLVVREESGVIRRYVHIGTGNYNPKTARIYEDFGLMSADSNVGWDVNKVFNHLSGFAEQGEYRRLLVAPKNMRSGLFARIEREIENSKAGKKALIRMKLNSLLDEEFVEALYRASQHGVKIDLVVRGICSIRVGIAGVSENITVRSIIGRFLEHSRIFHFHNAGQDEFWIGSGDLMHRNLDRRVEAMVQVTQIDHKRQLNRALDGYLSPKTAHWSMTSDGGWERILRDQDGTELLDMHAQVIDWYRSRG